MSRLVLRLPARPRLGARDAAGDAAAPRPPAEFEHVLCDAAGRVLAQGRAAAALLPAADRIVAVLAEADVAWHRIVLPRAPAARMRAALLGVLEDALLDEDEALHFALAPDAAPGQEGWVAVTHRSWLATLLAEIERHGRVVERVVPALAPGDAWRGHFAPAGSDGDDTVHLALAGPPGVRCLRLGGTLGRAWLPPGDVAVRWTAAPAAAAAAEAWLGHPVEALGDGEHLAEAVASPWNLRQFDLAPRHRGLRALRDSLAVLGSPAWRPVRWGLAALVAVQLVGLNALAWSERRAIAERRSALVALLQQTHPQVRAVLDAPVQMRRENERLRAAAGRPGDGDLEPLLAAAAAAWPDAQPPMRTLRFEPGRLTLAVDPWSDDEWAEFRSRAAAAGFSASRDGALVVVTPARGGRS